MNQKFIDFEIYGADAEKIQSLIKENPKLSEKLHEDLADMNSFTADRFTDDEIRAMIAND